jgi:hypothetical protein
MRRTRGRKETESPLSDLTSVASTPRKPRYGQDAKTIVVEADGKKRKGPEDDVEIPAVKRLKGRRGNDRSTNSPRGTPQVKSKGRATSTSSSLLFPMDRSSGEEMGMVEAVNADDEDMTPLPESDLHGQGELEVTGGENNVLAEDTDEEGEIVYDKGDRKGTRAVAQGGISSLTEEDEGVGMSDSVRVSPRKNQAVRKGKSKARISKPKQEEVDLYPAGTIGESSMLQVQWPVR